MSEFVAEASTGDKCLVAMRFSKHYELAYDALGEKDRKPGDVVLLRCGRPGCGCSVKLEIFEHEGKTYFTEIQEQEKLLKCAVPLNRLLLSI